jgi:hypothetical protein
MSSPLPYFKFWQKEWLSSSGTRKLGLAARGLFIDLLAFQWEDGFIPDDLDDIAAMVGIARADVAKVWPKVRAQFEEIGEGRLAHSRLADERDIALAQQQLNSINGRKGGLAAKPTPSETEPNAKRTLKRTVKRTLSERRSENEAIPQPEPLPETDNSVSPVSRETSETGGEPPGECEGSEREPNHGFDPIARVLRQVHSALKWAEPKPGDIRTQLREDAPIPALIDDFGEDGARDLFLWAYSNWTQKPTWASVFRQRHQIADSLYGQSADKLEHRKEPKEGLDYILCDVEPDLPGGRTIPVLPGTKTPFDKQAWYEERRIPA